MYLELGFQLIVGETGAMSCPNVWPSRDSWTNVISHEAGLTWINMDMMLQLSHDAPSFVAVNHRCPRLHPTLALPHQCLLHRVRWRRK